MIRKFAAALAALCLAACATVPAPAPRPASVIDVQILALNDFHGNVERTSEPIRFQLGPDQFATSTAGGAAIVGQELANLRSGHDYTITVAAGDRVTVNNFLGSGGDGYTVLKQGTDTFDAGLDLDALEALLATNPAVPVGGRIRDVTPR